MIRANTKPLLWSNPQLDYNTFTFNFDFRNKNNYSLLPLEAAIKTVEYIKNSYPEPYVLYLSGGIDSQAMLYAWHLSNVPFTTHSAIYNDQINLYDVELIKTFAAKFGIDVNYVSFDLYSFLDSEHDFYARTYYTGSPHFTTFLKMVDNQKEGTAIMSGNLFKPSSYYYDSLNNKPIKVKYTHGFEKNNLGMIHFAYKTQKNFVPFFFIETEYLTHSFSIQPNNEIEESHKKSIEATKSGNKIDIAHAQYNNKVSYYQNNGFPVIPQDNPERGKYHGFEKVKEHYDHIFEYKKNTLTGDALLEFEKEYKKLKVARTHEQISKRYFDIKYRNIYETFIAKHKFMVKL